MSVTPLTREIAAVAAVMDEIGQCRNPVPCHPCRQRMQSILGMGAAAERERLRAEISPGKLDLLATWFDADDALKAADPSWPSAERGYEVQAGLRRWAKLLREEPARVLLAAADDVAGGEDGAP